MFFPTRCPVCGRRGGSPCASCWQQMRPAPIAPPPPGVDHCLAVLRYEGAGRELVARLKYRDARTSLAWLGTAMAAMAAAHAVDVVTWAPTTRDRQLDRGFDQAALLAREVARQLGAPGARLLQRVAGSARRAYPRGSGARWRRCSRRAVGARLASCWSTMSSPQGAH